MSYSIEASSNRCYEGTTCLINKLNIRDEQVLAKVESTIVIGKISCLMKQPIQGNFDFEHYQSIHRFLFCDLYDWAGQIRDVNLSKKGTAFVSVSEIYTCGNLFFKRLREFRADGLNRRELAENIADFYHTLNMLHPFREGNGRTQRIFFAQWAKQCLNYQIDFSLLEPDEFMIATIYAAQGVMDYLTDCFDVILQHSMPENNISKTYSVIEAEDEEYIAEEEDEWER